MTTDELTLDSVILRSGGLISNGLGDDVVMMDVEQGSYYGLEAVAARIWTLTEQPISVGSLCKRLVTEYQISPEQCRADVMAFLGELLKQRLVHMAAQTDA